SIPPGSLFHQLLAFPFSKPNDASPDQNLRILFYTPSKLNVLGMSRNYFAGVLPSSISNLSTQLTDLYIGGNGISGTIPASLDNLVNLIILGLDYNYFTGIVPTNFGKFQKMQKCLVSILEIGLACSIGSPKERMKMKEVTSELHMIKKAFLGSGILLGGLGRIYMTILLVYVYLDSTSALNTSTTGSGMLENYI
ncbi:lrr receptor-like serine/threonine-protein kinase efr, partial [Quercus suber]